MIFKVSERSEEDDESDPADGDDDTVEKPPVCPTSSEIIQQE